MKIYKKWRELNIDPQNIKFQKIKVLNKLV